MKTGEAILYHDKTERAFKALVTRANGRRVDLCFVNDAGGIETRSDVPHSYDREKTSGLEIETTRKGRKLEVQRERVSIGNFWTE